jgi:hypothetical protein
VVTFHPILIKIYDDTTSIEARQVGENVQDLSMKIMALRTFDVKFSCGTQLTFGSLIFAAGENEELKMLPPKPAPGHLAPTSSSTSGRSCTGSGHCAGSYIEKSGGQFLGLIVMSH